MNTVPLPNVGEVFQARYRVEGQIGEGGFSKVFRAYDARAGDRLVALKILVPVATEEGRESAYRPDMADRFLREARVLSRLNHPNSIQMYDHGQTPQGLLYMVFEFVEGKSVYEEIRDSGPLSAERAVNVMMQTLQALHAAHSQAILHRDIKPNNIMLMRGPQGEQVKVLDFGIAKAFGEASATPGNDLTAAGTLVGTPRYMPPEQLRGHEMGPASDLYSFGIVAMEMLTGRKAIPGKDRLLVIQEQLTPHSLKLPPELNIPQRLRHVVERLLAKNIKLRYQSAAEVMRDLQDWRGSHKLGAPSGLRAPAPAPMDDATISETLDMNALGTVDMKQRVFRPSPQEQAERGETVEMGRLQSRPSLAPAAQETVEMAKLRREPSQEQTVLKTVNVAELNAAAGIAPPALSEPTIRSTIAPGGWRPTEDMPTDQLLSPKGASLPGLPKLQPQAPPSRTEQSGLHGADQRPPSGQYGAMNPPAHSMPPASSSSQSGLHAFGQNSGATGSGLHHAPRLQEESPWDTLAPGSLSARQSWQNEGSPAQNTGERNAFGTGERAAIGTGEQGFGSGVNQALARPAPHGLQPATIELTSNEKLILVASFFIPGLAHFLFGQKKKAIALFAGTFLTCGLGYLVSIAFVADAYLVLRTSRMRPVGDWEFFPDLKDVLG